MKKLLALVLALIICLCYAACGSVSTSTAATESTGFYAPADENAAAGAAAEAVAQDSGMPAGGSNQVSELRDDRKIIYTASMDLEAVDYDATVNALTQAVQTVGGYVASSSQYNSGSAENPIRSASYVFRIPADKYKAFLAEVNGAGNVTYQDESTEDVTTQYIDVEARLKSLRAQETRLMEMLNQAGELETLLAVQDQLTEVQYQIENYTAQQRSLDRLTAYSTVHVNIEEVKRITETQNTFGQRISVAFRNSWIGFADGCQNLVVAIVYLLPSLLVLAVIVVVVLVIVRTATKKSRARKAAIPQAYYRPVQPQPQAQPAPTTPEDAEKK